MNTLSRRLMQVKIWMSKNLSIVIVCLILLIGAFVCKCCMGDLGNWGDEIQILASIGTVFSVWLLFVTLRQTQSLYEAELLMKYDEMYGDRKMNEALLVLREVALLPEIANCRTRTSAYNPDCGLGVSMDYTSIASIEGANEARRLVKFYFINVLDYYRSGKISQDVARQIFNKNGIALLFRVVEPMENSLNSKYDYSKFWEIMILASDIWEKQKPSDLNFVTEDWRRRCVSEEQRRKEAEKRICLYQRAIVGLAAVAMVGAIKKMFRQ